MNLDDYAKHDGIALAEAIARGDYSAEEVIETSIEAIETLNPRLNAVVMKNYEVARGVANTAAGLGGPLAAVPFLVKDVNVFTADMPTTFSCRFFDGVAPRADSEIVRRWRGAGLIVLGKSNTPEFAEDFVCEPSFRGASLNPWDPGMTTGGSSGGAGAAVASGMVPIAHGTDLGGSIRIPAACCGVYGLKPSSGLSPVDASHAELASGFNSDHVLTRSVRDSAAALDATAHPVTGYRYTVKREVASFLDCLAESPRRLRIGVCSDTPLGEATPARQQLAVAKAAELLSDLGHDLLPYAYPQELDFGSWMDTLWMYDVVYEINRRSDELGRRPGPDEIDAMTRYLLELVDSSSAMDHYHARLLAHQNSVRQMTSMANLDFILTPSLGSDPVTLGSFDSHSEAFDYQHWMAQGWAFAPFSYICNMTGQPAASLPLRLSADEPPCAVQLAGHHGQDHVLLQLSAQLEQRLKWANDRPPIRVGN